MSDDRLTAGNEPVVVMVTGGCCRPGLGAIEQEAERITRQAIADSGVRAELRVVSVSAVARGGLPLEVVQKLEPDYRHGRIPLPAVLVGDELVSVGAPNTKAIGAALARLADPSILEEASDA